MITTQTQLDQVFESRLLLDKLAYEVTENDKGFLLRVLELEEIHGYAYYEPFQSGIVLATIHLDSQGVIRHIDCVHSCGLPSSVFVAELLDKQIAQDLIQSCKV